MVDMRPQKRDMLLEVIGDECTGLSTQESVVEQIRNGDEEFFEMSRGYWQGLNDQIIAALDSPYPQAYDHLGALVQKPVKDANENPGATLALVFAPAVHRVYGLGIRVQTHCNAVKTAVEIYIINAETGHFPQTLPPGLPKDLFSGEDFEYERKDDGFVLRCRGKNLDRDEIHEYEFKVKK
jgi:hypothetical protein